MKEIGNAILGAIVILSVAAGFTAVFWVTGDAILGHHLERFP